MPASPTTPVAIKLDTATKARFKRLAEARQRSSHWLMREAIQQYIDREEKREAFKQDAVSAWEAFQATGEHVTAEAAEQWLIGLEQGQETDPPEGSV
jgi:predicted transcriptional regulator